MQLLKYMHGIPEICQWISGLCCQELGLTGADASMTPQYASLKSISRFIQLVCFANKPLVFYSWGGVRLSPLVLQPLTCQPQMTEESIWTTVRTSDRGTIRRKILSQCHCVHNKSHITAVGNKPLLTFCSWATRSNSCCCFKSASLSFSSCK